MNQKLSSIELKEAARNVRLLLMDCDGVLTDGRLYYGESGESMKVFDVQDGLGIVRWHEAGFQSGIITGRSSKIVDKRASELGIQFVIQGSKNKLADVEMLCDTAGVSLSQTAFVGDDLPDIEVIESVGFGVAVANALEDVKASAAIITSRDGGRGAIREVIDLLLAARD